MGIRGWPVKWRDSVLECMREVGEENERNRAYKEGM